MTSRRAAVSSSQWLGADNFIETLYYSIYFLYAYQTKLFPDSLRRQGPDLTH